MDEELKTEIRHVIREEMRRALEIQFLRHHLLHQATVTQHQHQMT